MDAGTYAFWSMALSAFIAFLTVVLKLKWWKYSLGKWLVIFTGLFTSLCIFIFLLQLGMFTGFVRDQARALMYGWFTLVIVFLIADIWRKNWTHWAWSKDDEW